MSKIKNRYNILWFGEDMWKKLNHILIEKGMTKKELAEKAELVKTQSKTFGIVKSHFEIWSKLLTL